MARAAAKEKEVTLTAKQEHFCAAYFECRSGSAAYRLAYDAENMSAGAVHVETYKLLQNPHIAHRIDSLRAAIRLRTEVSLAEHLTELERLRDTAVRRDEMSAAIKAESLRGNALGFYVERKETGGPGDFDHLTLDQLESKIKADRAAMDAIERAQVSSTKLLTKKTVKVKDARVKELAVPAVPERGERDL